MKLFNGLDTDILVNTYSKSDIEDIYHNKELYDQQPSSVSIKPDSVADIPFTDNTVAYMSSSDPTRQFLLDIELLNQSYANITDDSRVAIGAKVYSITQFNNEEALQEFRPDFIYSAGYSAPMYVYILYSFLVLIMLIVVILCLAYGVYVGVGFSNVLVSKV
jgi:hypothetical protein